MAFTSVILHLSTVLVLFSFISLVIMLSSGVGKKPVLNFDPFIVYGKWATYILYFLRFLTLAPLPLSVFNFLGLLFYNTHPSKPKLRASTLFGPFLCFRVVTRGTFPDLVKNNVKRNIEICTKIGLDNFIFEVVTDNALQMPLWPHVRELVVPNNYKTKNGTLYKARALQYCLEDGINLLSDNDWIIHLDEETLLAESSLIGIVNFTNQSQYQFGQGVITYANEEIVSWITTMADLVRVGMDYGIIRFSLRFLHRPLFSWKGSFIVASAGAEKRITFDFGPEGSIAEDTFFAMMAWKEGYKFDFVEGEMWEKSTFSPSDYIHQRKRWIQGFYMTLKSKQIPSRYKIGIRFMMFSWVAMPLTAPNLILFPFFPVPVNQIMNVLSGFVGGTMMFLFFMGAVKSFSVRRIGFFRFVLICITPFFIAPGAMLLESIAVVKALWTRDKSINFHIVKKETANTQVSVDV